MKQWMTIACCPPTHPCWGLLTGKNAKIVSRLIFKVRFKTVTVKVKQNIKKNI